MLIEKCFFNSFKLTPNTAKIITNLLQYLQLASVHPHTG